MAENPEKAANANRAVLGMVGYQPSFARAPGDHGEFIARMDQDSRERWRAMGEWREDPQAESAIPLAHEWAEHVDYVIKTVGADHVAIGLDMVGGRSAVAKNASGYTDLVAALNRITTVENVRKIAGENWFRVLDQAKAS